MNDLPAVRPGVHLMVDSDALFGDRFTLFLLPGLHGMPLFSPLPLPDSAVCCPAHPSRISCRLSPVYPHSVLLFTFLFVFSFHTHLSGCPSFCS